MYLSQRLRSVIGGLSLFFMVSSCVWASDSQNVPETSASAVQEGGVATKEKINPYKIVLPQEVLDAARQNVQHAPQKNEEHQNQQSEPASYKPTLHVEPAQIEPQSHTPVVGHTSATVHKLPPQQSQAQTQTQTHHYQPSQNQPTIKMDQGLDIILVMDSSGSMKKTDPNDLRKPAAKLLLSLLGENDRASIISFSDQGYPVAYLTKTSGKLNTDILFDAVDRVSNKGGYTNLTGALHAAKRVVDQAWDSERKHVIVLMSDGKMDLASEDLDKKATAELITQLLPVLKNQEIQVHTIAFTDASDQRLLQSIASLTDGHFNIARTDRDLHSVFATIFEQSKQPDILPMQGNDFSVDHNVREITIVANKESLMTKVSFITPSGAQLEANAKPHNVKWLESDQFDLITITNPEPGAWQIFPEGDENRAYIITDLKMALQITPEHPEINDNIDIKVWLEEEGKLLNKPQVLAALRVNLVQDLPNGKSQRMALFTERSADGSLSGYFDANLLLSDYGRYYIEIVASTGTFDRIKSKVIDLTPKLRPEEVLAALEDPHSTALQPLAGAEYHPSMPTVYPATQPGPIVSHHEPQAALPLEVIVEEKAEESGVLAGVIIFMAFNLVIAIGVGIFWWLKRRKKVVV